MLLDPLPCHNCHTFSDPLPLERDVLYGRPPNGRTLTTINQETITLKMVVNSCHHSSIIDYRETSWHKFTRQYRHMHVG